MTSKNKPSNRISKKISCNTSWNFRLGPLLSNNTEIKNNNEMPNKDTLNFSKAENNYSELPIL